MARAPKDQQTARQKLEWLLTSKTTVSPEELFEASDGQLGGRNAIYNACGRGDYDCIRIGKRFFILTAPLRKRLGIEERVAA